MSSELHSRLLDEATNYDPAAHTRSLLAPYKDVLLVQRARFMSYEQIAAHFTKHGLKVSAAGVGYFCRRNFTKAEIERKRAELNATARVILTQTPPPQKLRPIETPATAVGRRGPKIARDDF